jgi:hypothetical protein
MEHACFTCIVLAVSATLAAVLLGFCIGHWHHHRKELRTVKHGDSNPNLGQKEAFMSELESEIWWEWHWEKLNRRLYVYVGWGNWIVRLLLLAFASYQIELTKNNASYSAWVTFCVAVLSMLVVALPLLSTTMKFQQRQEVHDRNAREYSVIRFDDSQLRPRSGERHDS